MASGYSATRVIDFYVQIVRVSPQLQLYSPVPVPLLLFSYPLAIIFRFQYVAQYPGWHFLIIYILGYVPGFDEPNYPL